VFHRVPELGVEQSMEQWNSGTVGTVGTLEHWNRGNTRNTGAGENRGRRSGKRDKHGPEQAQEQPIFWNYRWPLLRNYGFLPYKFSLNFLTALAQTISSGSLMITS